MKNMLYQLYRGIVLFALCILRCVCRQISVSRPIMTRGLGLDNIFFSSTILVDKETQNLVTVVWDWLPTDCIITAVYTSDF